MLTHCGATGLTTNDNSAVTVDELLQQVNVLVVDIHWARTFAIDKNRIFLDRFRASVFSTSGFTLSTTRSGSTCHYSHSLGGVPLNRKYSPGLYQVLGSQQGREIPQVRLPGELTGVRAVARQQCRTPNRHKAHFLDKLAGFHAPAGILESLQFLLFQRTVWAMKRSRFHRFLGHESLENRQLLTGLGSGEPVASIPLTDVNATSATFNQQRSAADFAGQTTAWYFTRSW